MTTLRWIIGIVTTLVTVGLLALSAIGDGFRRSFGASAGSPLPSLVIAAAGALIVLSVIWPDRRVLLHVTAVAMLALSIGCVYIARETMFVATVGLLYAAMWFVYYYRAVWR